MSKDTTEQTPREERAGLRAEFSRMLRGSLDRHDVTQEQLADLCGVAASKVSRWLNHRESEIPGAADVALFPIAIARDVMTWLGGHLRLTVADDLAFDELVDHLEHLHTVIREGSEVFAAYSRVATTGHTPTAAVRRDLMRELCESISAQTALLRDLEAQEAADHHGVQRRPSEPKMRAVGS